MLPDDWIRLEAVGGVQVSPRALVLDAEPTWQQIPRTRSYVDGSPDCKRLGSLNRRLEASAGVTSIHIPTAKASHSGSRWGSVRCLTGRARG